MRKLIGEATSSRTHEGLLAELGIDSGHLTVGLYATVT